MMLLAVLLPSAYFLLSGQIIKSVVCFILQVTLIGWLPAAIWAVANKLDRDAVNRQGT